MYLNVHIVIYLKSKWNAGVHLHKRSYIFISNNSLNLFPWNQELKNINTYWIDAFRLLAALKHVFLLVFWCILLADVITLVSWKTKKTEQMTKFVQNSADCLL